MAEATFDESARLIDVEVTSAPKGSAAPGMRLTLDFPEDIPSVPGAKLSVFGIFFLKSNDRNRLEPIAIIASSRNSVRDLFIPVSKVSASGKPATGANIESVVINELIDRYDEGVLGEHSSSYWHVLASNWPGPTDPRRGESERIRFLEKCVHSTNPSIRALGAGGLLAFSPVKGLEVVAAEPALADPVDRSGRLLGAVRERFREDSGEQIALLGRVAGENTASPALRRAAAHSLEAIHSRSCLPALRALLESDDEDLQLSGVNGLVSYALDFPIATSDLVPSLKHMRPRTPDTTMPKEVLDNAPPFDGFGPSKLRFLAFWRRWYDERWKPAR